MLPQVAGHFVSRMGKRQLDDRHARGTAAVGRRHAALRSRARRPAGGVDIDDHGEALWLTYYRSIFNPVAPEHRR